LHLGHKVLLLIAILAAEDILYIGVTGDNMLSKKKNKEIIKPLHLRMKEV